MKKSASHHSHPKRRDVLGLVAAVLAVLTAGAYTYAAVVEIATNGVTLGGTTSSSAVPSGAAFSEVHAPTLFETNVFLFDEPQTPLHLRLPASTNSIGAIVDDVLAAMATNNAFIPKWPATYAFETSSIPEVVYPNTATNEYAVRITRGSPGTTVAIHSKDNAGFFVPGASIYLRANSGGLFIISAPSTFASGDIKAASFTLGTNTITEWPTGGGGGGTASFDSRIIESASGTVSNSDYLIWMDSNVSGTNQVLTLPDMEEASKTIVVRQLGDAYYTTLQHGTNAYVLSGDGTAVALDWLGARTNWYWRQAY